MADKMPIMNSFSGRTVILQKTDRDGGNIARRDVRITVLVLESIPESPAVVLR